MGRAVEFCAAGRTFDSATGRREYWIEYANPEEIAIGRMDKRGESPGKPSTLCPVPFKWGWEKLLKSESGQVPARTIPKGVRIQEIAVVTLLEGIVEWTDGMEAIRFCD